MQAPEQTRGNSLLAIIAWDGVLPLLVALAPVSARHLFPDSYLAALTAALLIPFSAAMTRAHIGMRQIARVCAGHAPWWRQVALALAIILLLLFEIAVGVMTLAKDIPPTGWWFAIAFYVMYLVVITFALHQGQIE